jgi:hypothetical protein
VNHVFEGAMVEQFKIKFTHEHAYNCTEGTVTKTFRKQVLNANPGFLLQLQIQDTADNRFPVTNPLRMLETSLFYQALVARGQPQEQNQKTH